MKRYEEKLIHIKTGCEIEYIQKIKWVMLIH